MGTRNITTQHHNPQNPDLKQRFTNTNNVDDINMHIGSDDLFNNIIVTII
jgi:hypothetical protein